MANKRYKVSIEMEQCPNDIFVYAKNKAQARKKVYNKVKKQSAMKYLIKKETYVDEA